MVTVTELILGRQLQLPQVLTMTGQRNNYPDAATCRQLLREYKVPDNIVAHSLAVKEVAVKLAQALQGKGISVDQDLIASSALLHDIAKHICLNKDEDVHHPEAGAQILRKEGYERVADIVSQHGLDAILNSDLDSWEAKIVYYADKRVKGDQVVSLDQRLDYLRERYPDSLSVINQTEPLIKELETELKRELGCNREQDPLDCC